MMHGTGAGSAGFGRPPGAPRFSEGAGPGTDGQMPKRPLRRGTVRRVLELYRPYRPQLSTVIGLVLVGAVVGVITPLLIARVIDDALPARDRRLLLTLVGVMIGLTAVGGLLNVWQWWLNVRVGLHVMQDLRGRLYAHLQKQPLSFFTSTRTGDLQSRISNDVMNTQEVLSDTIANVISSLATVISSIVAMLLISWELSLVALSLVPVFALFTVRVGRRRRKLTGETQKALADLTSRTGETLSVSGVLLAKTFGREREQIERFAQDNRRLTDLSVRQQMTGRAFFIVVQTFFGMAPAIVWGIGGWIITGGSGSVTIGEMVAFTTIQVRVLFPLAGLLNRGVEISSALALFDRIFEYIDLRPAIEDPPQPVRVDRTQFRGQVDFEHVSFAYPSTIGTAMSDARRAGRIPGLVPDAVLSLRRPEHVEGSKETLEGKGRDEDKTSYAATGNGLRGEQGEFALDDVDFVAPAGQLTALVGPSGSGKTTVGYLLARLYDVQSGAVLVDGVDVRQMALEDLNRLIGVVTQDTFLFHASVRENLLYGRPSATEEEMVEAAKAAQLHDMVAALPMTYDTLVGERGYRLSGGERQRVAIARVLLADPRILLLDEATSSLDTLSERMIQDALKRLMAGRTTIAIAHRLSTVIAADQIIVVDRGRIVERGRHEELLARSGLYLRLYEEQFISVLGLAR